MQAKKCLINIRIVCKYEACADLSELMEKVLKKELMDFFGTDMGCMVVGNWATVE